MTKLTLPLQALLLSLVCLAGAAPRAAHANANPPFVAPADLALLVFIQNTRDDRTLTYTVFDLNKQCIAGVRGKQAELVPMKPGKHTLYISAYNDHRIDLSLAPGRTYFIRLFSTAKVTARASNVTVVQRGSDAYKQLGTWLQGANIVHVSDDPCSGKPLEERSNRTQRRINGANGDWKGFTPATQADYMLIQSDGLTAHEAGQL